MAYAAAEDLGHVRAFVRARALELGLAADRVDLLTVAVSELATNTLQHTSGGGRVQVWAEPGQLVCEVVDGGPDRSFGVMPPAESLRGRGLALVHKIVDSVTTATTAAGTFVRMRMNL
jgi:serine/threonine-protein kinase RsbW